MQANKANKKDDKKLVELIHIILLYPYLISFAIFEIIPLEKKFPYSLFTFLNTIMDYLPFLTA